MAFWLFCGDIHFSQIDRALTLSPKSTPSRFPTKSHRELKTFLPHRKIFFRIRLANENLFVVFIQSTVVIKTAVFWLEKSNNDEAGYFQRQPAFSLPFQQVEPNYKQVHYLWQLI